MNLGLTVAEVARRAGVTAEGVRSIEKGRVMPGLETVERIAGALNIDPRWLSFGLGQPTRTILLTPGYEPFRLWHELQSVLTQTNGYIADSLKYLDHAGADQWCELLKLSRFATESLPMPMADLVATLGEELEGLPFDLLGIGAGTALHELTLTARLLGRRRHGHDARAFLLDVSHPLLTFALNSADQILPKQYVVPVIGLLGDFDELASYCHLFHPDGPPRRRVLTMFGYTFSNLDNEIRFVRRNLSWVEKGDLLVLDLPAAVAQADRTDPALTNQRPVVYSELLHKFLTGPIRRHLSSVSDIKLSVLRDSNSSVVPGSYAIEHVAMVKMHGGETRRYSVGYSRRYETSGLCSAMEKEGWRSVGSFPYGPGFVLCAFRRDPDSFPDRNRQDANAEKDQRTPKKNVAKE
jgi:transcriptional regulator with XRE-family HTH domain